MSSKKVLAIGGKSKKVAMPLTLDQKVANAVFFERVFRQLNLDGIWCGDAGMMKKVKLGGEEVFVAEPSTYVYVQHHTETKWFNKRVVLFMDLSKIDSVKKI